ncbi:MAG TPA: EAL domain-containing protein [Acidimicrobiales bacterium]
MRVAVDGEEHPGSPRPGVSGTVVHALVSLIRSEAGEAGVAQALALASEERPFPILADADSWTPLVDAAALFTAGALVTGDGAIARHVGEDLLWNGNRGELATRLAALGSPEVAVRHIGALIEQFEGATEAVTLEAGPGHALIQVSPVGSTRHAHLCELTRGLLSELPAVFDRERARVTEEECAARGGRFCRYSMDWEPATAAAPVDADVSDDRHDAHGHPGRRFSPSVTGTPANGMASTLQPDEANREVVGREANVWDESDEHDIGDHSGPGDDVKERTIHSSIDVGLAHHAEIQVLTEQLRAARAAVVEASANAARWEAAAVAGATVEDERLRRQAEADAARTRTEISRLEHLLEGGSTPTLGLLERDSDAVVAELGERADRVLDADRFLLMIRVSSGTPLQLHHRGLDPDEARGLAAELWTASPDDVATTIQVVDIASSMRRYGRLAVLPEPDADGPEADDRVLRHFARYAANVLDVLTVVSDARRSDSTARTLLSFGEQLSGLTNLAQALQILADTVPAVTGCDQSTVYLWNRDRSRLVLGAYTTGMTPPDADLGPFTPHWAGAASTTEIRVASGGDGSDRPDEPHDDGTLSVGVDNPLIEQMISSHGVMVLDASTIEDPQLRALMEASDIPASVVAPLFAAGEFLGVIAANFAQDTSRGAIRDPDLHERLSGLADQAATAIQNLELLEKVSHMAWHDALTGLPNRRLFEDRVEQELVRSRRVGEPVSMFFVDLDNFKTVNDTYGHATGDVLIQQVGQRLVETVRSQDTVARLGGDEFAILLPGLVDQLAINQLAERTLDAMHTPFDIFGQQVSTSASVGIAIAPEHGDSYDDLLNRADEAMFRAKDHGRNAFEMFHSSPDPAHPGRRSVDDRQLYNDLISALDGNEFFLVYQPYIDLRTAQIVGVEALIRWDHPTLGILEPPQFIPMAEKSDLIISLDNWVLWQACRQLRTWQDHDLDQLRLSVNLASRDLASPTFYDSVERTLRDTGIEPSLLELEITDRVVLDTSGPATDNIDRLRRLGVRFTIDDFGQGNSSLDRIGSFPVSTLKIDQSFVQVLGPTDEENSLVSAIIAMAGRLGLSCVAEGVETLLQSRVLLQRGCTTAQGYYFSPPLPPEGIEEMLANLSPAEVPESFGNPSSGSQPPEKPNA